jgi:hypothetical protein
MRKAKDKTAKGNCTLVSRALKALFAEPVEYSTTGRATSGQALLSFPARGMFPARMEEHQMMGRSDLILRVERERLRSVKKKRVHVACCISLCTLLSIDLDYVAEVICRLLFT